MTIYIVPSPLNKLDKKGRVSGWRNIPIDRKEMSAWKLFIQQLKDKGVQYVVSSDLDSLSANIMGTELNVPVKTEYALRRFHYGRHHASMADHLADILAGLEEKWKTNPNIPIRGGDSLTSFSRRFSKRINELLSSDGIVAFVSDPLTIAFIRDGMTPHALVPNGNPVRRDRIYKAAKG